MTGTPSTTVRISERLTPLRGIAAISDDGFQGGFDGVPAGKDRRVSHWSRFWRVTDPALREMGAKGERLIAKFRLFAVLMLLVLPVKAVLASPDAPQNWVGLAITTAGVLSGCFFLWLSHRDVLPPWIGFAASILDVTWVSVGLGSFVALGLPQIAVNSRVIFEVYFICLGATCLRYDRRISLVTGIVAMVQYSAIIAWASRTVGASNTWLDGSYGHFDMQDQGARVILLGLATLVSMAIVLRVQQLRVLSVRDRLTGLMIRGYFDERVSEAYDRARRTNEPLAVAMIDLDYFKSFNDRFGHAVGDLVLASVSRTIRSMVRTEDVVGRYGGEELIVMLPGLDRIRATERMERIRRAVAQVRVELDTNSSPHAVPQTDLFPDDSAEPARTMLTASIGVASWPEDAGDTVEALIYRADARLLSAKSTGRNRVVSSSGMTDEFAIRSA